MGEWLAHQNPRDLIGLAGVIVGPLIAVVAIVCAAWTRVRRTEAQAHIAELEAALKQQMIEKGMSADEIERVLSGDQGPRPELAPDRSWGTLSEVSQDPRSLTENEEKAAS